MDNFWRLLHRQVDKKIYYVEDFKNRYKHKELTVVTNGGSIIFDQKGRLTFLSLNVHVNEDALEKIPYFKDVDNIPGVNVTLDT